MFAARPDDTRNTVASRLTRGKEIKVPPLESDKALSNVHATVPAICFESDFTISSAATLSAFLTREITERDRALARIEGPRSHATDNPSDRCNRSPRPRR